MKMITLSGVKVLMTILKSRKMCVIKSQKASRADSLERKSPIGLILDKEWWIWGFFRYVIFVRNLANTAPEYIAR